MTARSSQAFLVSLLIHGLVVGALCYSAYFLHDADTQNKIMELVAGAGDNYAATEAPALGNPDSQNVDTAATPEISPVAAVAEPQALEAVAPPPVAPAHPAQKSPDFVKQMDRVEKRTLKKIEKRDQAEAEKEAKAEAAREKAAAAAVKNNLMTKEEFDKKFGSKATSEARTNGPIKVAKIDGVGIAAGVRGGSRLNTKGGAGGTQLTREEGDELDAYFSELYQHLKDAHQKPEGLSDLLSASVQYDIAHDGTISHVEIVHSSGSPEFDQSVLYAFRKVGSIGPRPDSGGMLTRIVKFKMRDED